MLETNCNLEKINVLNKLNEETKRKIKHLFIFGDYFGDINVISITIEDKVYCFGGNSYGVLGFGHEKIVEKFTFNEELSFKSIIDIKNSWFHTIACDSNGKLHVWGSNRYLGIGKKYEEISKPELNKYLVNENIIDMCCGSTHTLVLTSNNKVYKVESEPFELDDFKGEKVEAISCGSFHSLALTESGHVYSWGDNRSGQLGLNSEIRKETKPQRIQLEVKIKKISCGSEHSLLLSREGDIYVFGLNQFNQLGLITNNEKQLNPKKLNHSEKFVDIASHYRFKISAAQTDKGLYYIWGECKEVGIISEPKKTQNLKTFEEIFLILNQNFILWEQGKYMNYWTELPETLGRGSYGEVVKVKSKLIENTIFAMKKIPYSGDKDSFKELRILDMLKDENEFLVKYYNGWIEEDLSLKRHIIYIQMDFCDKTLNELHEEIKEDSKLYTNNSWTHLGYHVLSKIFIEILIGVEYLHSENIIHRDLHPNNILVKRQTNGNCIKIADFGLAKVHEMNKLHTQDRGHPRYIAPEVDKGRKYDTRADIYSLGVILQELFDINVNSDYMNNENTRSILISKYKKASTLSLEMKNEIYSIRPNCEQMLNRRVEWAINKSEFNFEEELNILLEIGEENRSYVQNIIVSKLSNIEVDEKIKVSVQNTSFFNSIYRSLFKWW